MTAQSPAPGASPEEILDRLRAIETQLPVELMGNGAMMILARDVKWMAAAIRAALAAAPTLPGWTSEPPAVPGYYWLDREGRDGGIAWCDTRGAWCPDFHTFSELHVRAFAGPLEAPPSRASAGEREGKG